MFLATTTDTTKPRIIQLGWGFEIVLVVWQIVSCSKGPDNFLLGVEALLWLLFPPGEVIGFINL